jgi:hypothetical protein
MNAFSYSLVNKTKYNYLIYIYIYIYIHILWSLLVHYLIGLILEKEPIYPIYTAYSLRNN